MTSEAVHSLVVDPIWKTESGVASTPVARLSSPVAASMISPSARTPSAAPGTPCCLGERGQRSSIQASTWRRVLMRPSLRRMGRGCWTAGPGPAPARRRAGPARGHSATMRMLVGMSEPEMTNSAPVAEGLARRELAKGTTSAAGHQVGLGVEPGRAALGALHRGGGLHAGVVVGVGDGGEVGAAVGHARSGQEGHELVRAADVQGDPGDVPVTGAEEGLLGGGACPAPCRRPRRRGRSTAARPAPRRPARRHPPTCRGGTSR